MVTDAGDTWQLKTAFERIFEKTWKPVNGMEVSKGRILGCDNYSPQREQTTKEEKGNAWKMHKTIN